MPLRQPSTTCVVVPFVPRAPGAPHPRGRRSSSFPVAAGILFGLGLGGFLEGVVLQQILQWHHMLTSAGYGADSIARLRTDRLWDGLFQTATCAFAAAGVVVLWRAARWRHAAWSSRLLAGTMLIGFGAFNLVEGIVNHHLLGLHHVNETVAREQWLAWDLRFLVWGVVMLVVGHALVRSTRPRTVPRTDRGAAAQMPRRR